MRYSLKRGVQDETGKRGGVRITGGRGLYVTKSMYANNPTLSNNNDR
jgi:hypothetical protein